MSIPQRIKDLANKVRNEIYGKDVRESIAQSMEVTGETAEDAKVRSLEQTDRVDTLIRENPQPSEVVDARGDFDILRDRLNSSDQQLAQNQEEFIKSRNVLSNKVFYNNMTPSRKNRGVMVLIDDDAMKEVYTVLKPLMEELQVPITSAVITSRIDNNSEYLTSVEMEELAELGMEFVGHSHNHINLQESTPEAIHNDLIQNRNWLLDRGYNADVLVYPFGIADFTAREITAQYFRYGVLSDRGDGEINRPPLKSFGLQRAYIDYGVSYITDRIDDISVNGGGLIVGMHSFYQDFNPQDVRDIVAYARANNVDIVNMRDFHSYYGNLLEFGTASNPEVNGGVIDSEYEIHGMKIGKMRSKTMTSADVTMLPDDYKFDCETYGTVMSSEAQDFPESAPGRLTVKRFRSPLYDYRTYELLNTEVVYKQKRIPSQNLWGDWYKIKGESPEIERNVSIGNRGGQQTRDFVVGTEGWIGNYTYVMLKPIHNLPEGIIATTFINEDDEVILRIANVTTTAIDLGNFRFGFKFF